MQQMQCIFNSRMQPIATREEYPKYARSGTMPVVRARQIIDQGVISDHPCSTCVELKQDCYRWEGTFSKCAYCTSKDRKRELCHVTGQEALPAQARRKRRKITHNIYAPSGDAASTADTMTYTFVSGATPFTGIPTSDPRGVRERASTPTPASAMTDIIRAPFIHTQFAPAAVARKEPASAATLERVTALEYQVSSLEAKVVDVLVRLDEVGSCVSSSSTPRRQPPAAGASPTTSDVAFGDLQARHLSDAAAAAAPSLVHVATAARRATREWVVGFKSPELPGAPSPVEVGTGERVEEEATTVHTVEHPESYKPVNCACTGP